MTQATRYSDKVIAARRLVASLNTPFDFGAHELGHPNETEGLDRMIDAMNATPDEDEQDAERWDGMS